MMGQASGFWISWWLEGVFPATPEQAPALPCSNPKKFPGAGLRPCPTAARKISRCGPSALPTVAAAQKGHTPFKLLQPKIMCCGVKRPSKDPPAWLQQGAGAHPSPPNGYHTCCGPNGAHGGWQMGPDTIVHRVLVHHQPAQAPGLDRKTVKHG